MLRSHQCMSICIRNSQAKVFVYVPPMEKCVRPTLCPFRVRTHQVLLRTHVCTYKRCRTSSTSKMGRVSDVYHGSDRRVRPVLVITKNEKKRNYLFWYWNPCSLKVFFARKTGPALMAPVNCKIRNWNLDMTVENLTQTVENFAKIFVGKGQPSP